MDFYINSKPFETTDKLITGKEIRELDRMIKKGDDIWLLQENEHADRIKDTDEVYMRNLMEFFSSPKYVLKA